MNVLGPYRVVELGLGAGIRTVVAPNQLGPAGIPARGLPPTARIRGRSVTGLGLDGVLERDCRGQIISSTTRSLVWWPVIAIRISSSGRLLSRHSKVPLAVLDLACPEGLRVFFEGYTALDNVAEQIVVDFWSHVI